MKRTATTRVIKSHSVEDMKCINNDDLTTTVTVIMN